MKKSKIWTQIRLISGLQKKIVLGMMVLSLCVCSMMPGMTVKAEGFKLDDGFYQTFLDITDWNETEEVTSGLRVSQRASLIEMSNGSMSAMQIQITGYSQYDAIYMVKQDADISEIDISKGGKIGDWTELTNYDVLKENGYVDESLNDKFIKLTPDEDSIDTATDTAVFTLNSWSGYAFDCTKKVGLVGCLKRTMTTKSAQCNSITIKANPDFTKSTKLPSCILNQLTDLDLTMNINTWKYGSDAIVTANSTWNMLSQPTSAYALKQFGVTKVTYEIKDEKVIAKIYLTDDFKTADTEVYEINSRDTSKVKNDKTYKAYLAGNGGVTWGTQNLYDEENGCITVSFTSSELLYGKDIKFYTSAMKKSYETINICLSEYDYGPVTIENETYGIFYTDRAKELIGNLDLGVSLNSDEDAMASIAKVCGEGDYRVYTFNLTKDNQAYTFRQTGGILYIPVPDEWELDSSKLYAEVTYKVEYEGQKYLNIQCTYPDIIKSTVLNGHNYLVCTFSNADEANTILHGGSFALGQVKQKQDVSNLSEGVYKAEVGFLKAGTQATSMASGTLDSEAYLTVDKDGNKAVYMGFHRLDMVGESAAYMGAVWNNTDTDVTYYDYETDENGKLLDNCSFDAVEGFACVKSAKVEISDSTWDTENLIYRFKVIPPAMGAGDPYDYVYSHPIDADLVFFSVEKVDDSTTIPSYQKSVLRKSIDKAERYNESSYSADSWAALKSALEDGKAYYNTLAGTDAGTDSNISDTIKEKSDAIENAIKALVENPELEAARTALKQAIDEAKTVELGNKTVSAFNELAAAIDAAQATYERSNVTIEELNAQVTTLAAAVETFKNSPNASTLDPVGLEDGEYKVYADMKKVDKTTDSMSNNAIDHWINLKVENGNYTAILDFNGMTISGQFGYLMNLSYYEAGYTYTSTGDPTGKLTLATVLSTQKDAQGNDIIDNFNDAQNLYPDIVAFPLVDKGTQQYVPLQVYVPIMENITAGTGTQNVLMKIDWTSLKSADDDTQEEIPLEDGLYTVSSDLRETGSEEKSTFNQYLDKVRLLVQDGTVKAYIDFKNVEDGDTEKYVTLICFDDGDGVKAEEGRLDRAVLTLPKNVELTNVHLEDSTGAKVDARLYLALRSAAAQSADKTKLKEFIVSAQNILQDGKTYTDVSVSTLREALERVEQVDADEVAIGSEISSAGLALKNAIDTMEEVLPVTVDKTELKALLEEAANISNEDGSYTQQSYKIFTEALENAKSVDADEEATQEEVDYQIKVLRAAMDGLVKETEQDKSDLKAAIAEAEKLDAERDSYTAESWSAFAAAYNAAVRVAELEHASAAEIDAHTKNLRAAMEALIKVSGSDGELADGTYEINAEIVNATDPSKLSMADGALSHSTDEDGNEVKDPLLLIVKDGQYSVRMKFVELSSKLGDEPFSGYLGELSYYPDYDKTDELPGEDEKLEAATVESEYDGYDEYNDPDFGSDKHMQGKKYPKQLSIPVTFNDTEIWLKVYVPVMESISEGGGTQQARLHLDWSSVKAVRSEDVDVSALEDQLQYASGLEQGEASDETWNALQQAVTAAKAAYENPSLTQEQIDAQVTLLQRAMAAVQAENDQKADKTQLQALLTKAQEELAKTDVYTVSSREALQVIATYAQTVYEDENADQNSVDAAAKALESAINGLTALSSIDTSVLESEITKAEALVSKTDVYTADSLQTLQIAINNAKRVLADADMTQEQVDRQVTALQNAQKGLIEKTYADKSALQAKITEAEGYAAETSKYTASTIAALKTAISNAQTVYADGNASQAVVDNQVTLLTRAIANLEEIEEEIKQDTSELADGVYSIKGKMVKVDKSSASMSNEAINHYVKLTVKNGKYYLTLDFCGLKYAGKYGYLGWLKYYKSGYSTDKYGNPTGSLGSVTVDSVQKDSKGKTISDSYGSNYPNQVTFPMISEALTDGYVPLQVYVPVMESISAGTGTQPVYLKLTWSSLKKTTSDDDVFADNTSTDDTDDDDTSTSSLLNFKSTLKTSTLGTGLLNNSSLKSSNSSLKSSNSSLGSNTTSLKGSNASLKGNASLTGTGTELSSALENGELLSSLASAEEQSAGTVAAGQTKTTSDQTTGSKVPVVPIATSLVVMLAGILYKLKSRGLLKLR